ncbi:3424_t:CDS:2 [Paraglomus brasilianum]|uniref:3424_t:CDS:1 n=1 Tax=Paraglomus brasilianum TaxID=144538 RepID=A0A9N9CVF2_9GLOM|nr:3424_t:CDS:2 [Paraglomus brasilianum]
MANVSMRKIPAAKDVNTFRLENQRATLGVNDCIPFVGEKTAKNVTSGREKEVNDNESAEEEEIPEHILLFTQRGDDVMPILKLVLDVFEYELDNTIAIYNPAVL